MFLLNEAQIAELLEKCSNQIKELQENVIMLLETRNNLLDLERKQIHLRANKIYQFWINAQFFLDESWEGFQLILDTHEECVIIYTNGIFHAGFCNTFCDKKAWYSIITHPERYIQQWTAKITRKEGMIIIKIKEDIEIPPFTEGRSLHIQFNHNPIEYLKRWVLYQNQFPNEYAISLLL